MRAGRAAARPAAAAARRDRSRAAALRGARAAGASAARHAYFQQELVQTLADGDPALLGEAAVMQPSGLARSFAAGRRARSLARSAGRSSRRRPRRRICSRPSTPPVPENVDDYWFAPRAGRSRRRAERRARRRRRGLRRGQLPGRADLGAAGASPPAGRSSLRAVLHRPVAAAARRTRAEADKAFDAVLARKPEGYLSVAAMLGKAEAAELRGDHAAAARSLREARRRTSRSRPRTC